jgi:hypothetical protein
MELVNSYLKSAIGFWTYSRKKRNYNELRHLELPLCLMIDNDWTEISIYTKIRLNVSTYRYYNPFI